MTSRRRTDDHRPRPLFSEPPDLLDTHPRRGSQAQRRVSESARRDSNSRRVRQLSARHYAPLQRRLAIYGVLTVGITLAVWRFTHWLLWRIDPIGLTRELPGRAAVARPPLEGLATGLATRTEPAAWVNPVGLIVGLALGLIVTWLYARYFEGL